MKINLYSTVFVFLLLSALSSLAKSPAIIPWTNDVPTNAVLTVRCNEAERCNARVAFLVAEARLEKAVTNHVSAEQLAVFQEQYDTTKRRLQALEEEIKTRGHVHEWVPTTNKNSRLNCVEADFQMRQSDLNARKERVDKLIKEMAAKLTVDEYDRNVIEGKLRGEISCLITRAIQLGSVSQELEQEKKK